MIVIRRQLTLFLSDPQGIVEKIRAEFNPIQYELIPAHVTLCREDEIESIEKVIKNVKSITIDNPLTIEFGRPERFDNGKGLLIPSKGDCRDFQQLRKNVLKGIDEFPRKHRPHITLMHPRNSTCTDEIFNKVKESKFPEVLSFEKISLIEQKEGSQWRTINQFSICREMEGQ